MKFETHGKKGNLTRYGFSCGYVETVGRATIAMEHNIYTIKAIHREPYQRHYEVSRTLTDARKIARKLR